MFLCVVQTDIGSLHSQSLGCATGRLGIDTTSQYPGYTDIPEQKRSSWRQVHYEKISSQYDYQNQ